MSAPTIHAHEFGHVIWGLSHVDTLGFGNNIMHDKAGDGNLGLMKYYASESQVKGARDYIEKRYKQN
jgi:hypothetical protein